MASANTLITEAITTIHTENEPSINVEHFFDIQELEKVCRNLNETLLFSGTRHFFDEPQTIYLELIRTFGDMLNSSTRRP